MAYYPTQAVGKKMKTGMKSAKKASAGTLKNVAVSKKVPAPKSKKF